MIFIQQEFALGLQLTIIFTVKQSVAYFDESICCLVHKMFEKTMKNVHQCFPKPKMKSSNVLFCPQPKGFQFNAIDELTS